MKTLLADSTRHRHFLAGQGWQTGHIVRQIGAANRHEVFLLEDGSRRAVLKLHEPCISGRRDAFAHEALLHSFYAEQVGDLVPRLIAQDAGCRALLFEHLLGEQVTGEESGLDDVARMAGFLLETNRPEVLERARQARLPRASDAGISNVEHWQCASSRLDALLGLPVTDEPTAAMKDFVRSVLRPALEKCKPDQDVPIQPCLSPSDFGFHNVIRRADGSFCFLDFEHAGWDDPAKLIADFILQPEAPLSKEQVKVHVEALGNEEPFGADLPGRLSGIVPVQKVKWAVIILNVFQKESSSSEAKLARLSKARDYWCKV